MPSPIAVEVVLSEAEREQLESWARRGKSAQALAQRSRIVLAAAEGLKNTEIAQRLGLDHATVRKWRSRFAVDRLDGLVDEPRPGRPRTVSDAQVEEVIVAHVGDDAEERDALVDALDGGARSASRRRRSRGSGGRSGCSRTARRRGSCRETHCSSTRSVTSSGCTSTHPSAPSFCASMRRARSRRWIAARRSCRCCPARPQRATHDYKRSGTSSLYAALDLTTGKVIGVAAPPPPRDRVQEVPARRSTATVPADLDGAPRSSTTPRRTRPLRSRRWLAAAPRFVLHFTPTSSSG